MAKSKGYASPFKLSDFIPGKSTAQIKSENATKQMEIGAQAAVQITYLQTEAAADKLQAKHGDKFTDRQAKSFDDNRFLRQAVQHEGVDFVELYEHMYGSKKQKNQNKGS